MILHRHLLYTAAFRGGCFVFEGIYRGKDSNADSRIFAVQMLQRSVNIVITLLFSFLLLFGGTAKEFVHGFTGHVDTEHCNHRDGELSFENEHHHCSFLSYSLPAFHQDHFIPVVLFSERSHETGYRVHQAGLVHRQPVHTSLRGPPVCHKLQLI